MQSNTNISASVVKQSPKQKTVGSPTGKIAQNTFMTLLRAQSTRQAVPALPSSPTSDDGSPILSSLPPATSPLEKTEDQESGNIQDLFAAYQNLAGNNSVLTDHSGGTALNKRRATV